MGGKANPDSRRKAAKRWRDKNPEFYADWHLKRKYGIGIEEYKEMFFQQNGVCAVCDEPEKILNKRLSVDHDHKTGKVRQLLCTQCNAALGNVDDNIDRLQRMIKYLKSHKVDDLEEMTDNDS